MCLVARLACNPTVYIRGRFCGNHELVFNIHGNTRHMGARCFSSSIQSSHSERLQSPEPVDERAIMPGTCSLTKKETVLTTLIDENVGDPHMHQCSGVIFPTAGTNRGI